MTTTIDTIDTISTSIEASSSSHLNAPLFSEVWTYTGYSHVFENNVTIVVYSDKNRVRFSCVPYSNGERLGLPSLHASLDEAISAASKAF